MLYNIKVPVQGRICDLIVETTKKYTLSELKERLYDEDISEDFKDDISFAKEMTIVDPQMKTFLIERGFKIFEIKEEK